MRLQLEGRACSVSGLGLDSRSYAPLDASTVASAWQW